MRTLKDYYNGLKLTMGDFKVLCREYSSCHFHPRYLEELLCGRYTLLNPTMLTTLELGNKNPDCTVAFISLDRGWVPTAGFFALLNRTLCGLYFADKMGFVPVVSNWDGCAYEEENGINGVNNVFEYYFLQPGNCSVSEALQSKTVVIPSNNNMDIILNEYKSEWYQLSDGYFRAMGKVFRKYMHLNACVSKRMAQDIASVLKDKKTLGIHFRGSDYRINANGHPVSLDISDYYDYIQKAVREEHFEQIFIATDDLNVLEKLKKKFADVVFYRDVKRTKGDVSVAFLKDDRKEHKYNLGYEVLRDAYTLASCDGLIAGHSQVAVGARIIKESKKENYDYFALIKKGINHNKKEWISIYDNSIKHGTKKRRSLDKKAGIGGNKNGNNTDAV